MACSEEVFGIREGSGADGGMMVKAQVAARWSDMAVKLTVL